MAAVRGITYKTMRKNKLIAPTQTWAWQLENSFAVRELGVLVDRKLAMSQKDTLEEKKSVSWTAIEKVLPASWWESSFLSTPHWWDTVEVPSPVLVFPVWKGNGNLDWVQKKAKKIIKVLEHLSHGEVLWELCLFILERGKA